MNKHLICHIEELDNLRCKEFHIQTNKEPIEIFIIHEQEQFYCYLNQCPHTGVNLNWMPDQFLDYANHYIQCSTHGALFRVKDGYCVRGPCAGDALTKLDLINEQNRLYVML